MVILRHLRVRPSLTIVHGRSRPHLPARGGVENLSHSDSDQLLPAGTTGWRIMQGTLCTNTHGSWLALGLTATFGLHSVVLLGERPPITLHTPSPCTRTPGGEPFQTLAP